MVVKCIFRIEFIKGRISEKKAILIYVLDVVVATDIKVVKERRFTFNKQMHKWLIGVTH